MKIIKLTQGYECKVDDSDYEVLSKRKWQIHFGGSKNTHVSAVGNVNGKHVFMHRFIMGVTERNIYVDHKDHDSLNNQRSNLRFATHSQNRVNKKHDGFIGIERRNHGKSFRACVYKCGVRYRITAKTEVEAALAYNKLALEHHGEFASLNVVNL